MTQTELFARDYLGSIFYFCLKKTGDRAEAEELSADIALTVVDSLAKCPPPEHFSAWVWTIARRRYTKWVDKRCNERAHTAINPEDDSELPSDGTVDEKLLEAEQYSLLRRELAFISRDYRELLVRHYIDDIGISELSRQSGIPAGTVKTRLYKARKILKEGMDMAREFGKRSYKPEQISFNASGNMSDRLPYSVVQRKIPVNILLEANNNPSTIEELSMELGVAVPYMEDEVAILEKATLLQKVGDKYVTNFYIASKEVQLEIRAAQRSGSSERTRLLDEAVNGCYSEIYRLMKPALNETDFKWFLYVWLIDKLLSKVDGMGLWDIFKRPNGGNWGFCGYEQYSSDDKDISVNHNLFGSWKTAILGCYAVTRYGFSKLPWGEHFNTGTVNLLRDILINSRSISSLTSNELAMLNENALRFAHVENDRLIPDIAVLHLGDEKMILDAVMLQPSAKLLMEKLNELFASVRGILERSSNEVLHKTLNYYTSMFMCDIRGMLMIDCVDSGVLTLPDKPETSVAGAYLDIK